MRETNGRQRRVSIKLKAAAAALVAIFAVAAVGASGAQAASTPGGAFGVDFNYVGLNVGIAALGEVNQVVLTPETPDPANPGGFLPPLHMAGTYNDATGNFTLQQATGLQFPQLAIDLGPGSIEAQIGLTAPAIGNYNDATGEMSVSPKIALTLGTDHIEDVEGLQNYTGGATGELRCEFSPLDVSLSTNSTNWPAPGQAFTDKALLKDGALAGAWRSRPKTRSIAATNGDLCKLIGSLIEPVGGLWLANSTTPIAEFPAPNGIKPEALPCPAGTTGTAGTPPDECKVKPPVCEAPQTGTPPNCKDPIVTPPKKTPYKVSKVAISPRKGKIKAGKKLKIKIKVTNSGETDGSSNVALKSNNKKVKVPKSVKISVPAGETASKTVTVKALKKAKGKVTITAKAGSKTTRGGYDVIKNVKV